MIRMMTAIDVDLRLFDGEGAGAPAADGGTTASASGEMTFPGVAGRGKAGEDLSKVVYGKTDGELTSSTAGETAPSSSDAASENEGATAKAEPSPKAQREALRQEYHDLTRGKFKDFFAEDTQALIDKRFKETKALESRLDAAQPIFDALAQKYGVDADDIGSITKAVENDDALIEDAADEAGMTVQQYRRFQQLFNENRRLQKEQAKSIEEAKVRETAERWHQEAQALKAEYKDFDLRAELSDPNFAAALKAGVPMKLVYQGKYFDKYLSSATTFAATQAQKATVENIRAKGTRPVENGTASQSAFTTKPNLSELTLEQFKDYARRVAHGEYITF